MKFEDDKDKIPKVSPSKADKEAAPGPSGQIDSKSGGGFEMKKGPSISVTDLE